MALCHFTSTKGKGPKCCAQYPLPTKRILQRRSAHCVSKHSFRKSGSPRSVRLRPRYEGMAACPIDLCEHHAAAGSPDEHHQLQGCARDGENTFALLCASFDGEAQKWWCAQSLNNPSSTLSRRMWFVSGVQIFELPFF